MKRTFIKKGFFAFIATLLTVASFAQTITNVTVNPASVCAGSSVSVDFTATSIPAGTVYTAQLSDAAGAFGSPVVLGTGTVNPISGVIPVAASAGTNYKIRVISASPAVTGSESAITVNEIPVAPTVTGTVNYTVGAAAELLKATGANLKWYTTETGGTGDAAAPKPSTAAAGTTSYWVSQTVDCESPRSKIDVIVTAACVPPAAPTVSNVNYTVGDAASALAATGTNLLWYTAATGGTGTSTIPTPTTTAAGTTSYWVTQSEPVGCESPRAKIDVIVTAACVPPAAPTVSNVSYTVGDATSALAATGTNLLWYTTATGGTGSSTIPTPTTTAAGTTSYWVTQSEPVGCESPRAKIDVIVTAACVPPAAPTVSNVSYTVGAAASELTATGVNKLWYTTATGGTGSSTAPTPSTTTAGTTSYWVSQTVGCESPRAKIDVIVTAAACVPPAAPTVSNVNYTVGAAASELTATGVNKLWYTTATGGTGSSTAPTPSTATVGTTSYWVSQTVGCESPRAKIDVIVTAAACVPPAAPAVVNKTYTVGDSPVPLNLSVTGSNLLWYTAATGGTGSSTIPTPSTATAGTTSYWVSQTVGCESPRAKIDVIVTAAACVPPAAPTVSNVNYTVGAAASELTATGVNKLWYTTATGGTGSSTAPTPSTATAGTTSYWVSQTVGCESPRAKIDVIVSACTLSAAPTVTSPTNYCASTVAVPALIATGTAVQWYNATGTKIAAPVPNVNVSATTSTTYFVTQTEAGKCESAKKEVVITVNKTPAPAVSTNVVEYCLNTTAPALVATGSGLKWYNSSTGTTEISSTPNTTVAGNFVFYVSQTLNGCESERARIDVKIKALPTAPIVTAPATVCQNTTVTSAVLLNAVSPKTNLLWYSAETGGTGTTTVPTPVTTNSTNYYVSQTSNGCESARVKISLNVRALPVAPTVTPIEYCKDITGAVALTATGTALKWYSASGTLLSAAPVPSTATVGTVSYYVSQTETSAALSCEGPRAKIDVVVNPLPAALPAISDAVCQEPVSKTYTFLTQPANGNTVNWYTAATGGTPAKTVPAVNLNTSGETTYYVTQVTAKGCESAAPRSVQKIRVKPLPLAPAIASSPVEYCQFIVAKPLTATPVANGILNWYGTDASGGTATSTAPTPSTANGGTTTYYVGQTLEGCVGERTKIDVKINTTPKPTTTSPLAYCQNEVAPRLEAAGTTLKWYRTASDTAWQGFPYTPYTGRVEDYSFYVTQTGADNGCESPKEEIKIHIKALPSATISGSTTIDLGQTANLTLKFTSDGPWKYTLSSGLTDSTDQATKTIQVTPTVTTSYSVTAVSNSCGKGTPIGSAVVTVKIPTIFSGNPTVSEVCAGKSFGVPFQQSGEFPATNKFNVQISLVNADSTFYTIPSVATSNSITATFPDTTVGGNYFIRVVSSGTNPALLIRGTVSAVGITASPLPVATLSGAKTILIGDAADLKVELTGKSPWSFALYNGVRDSLITAISTPYSLKISPAVTTTYSISTVSNVCGKGRSLGSARIQVDPILGVEPPVTDWLKVYPTVVDGQECIVEIEGPISPKEAKVEVTDMNGRPVFEKVIRTKTTGLDFEKYPSGLYLLRIQNGNLNSVHRVMKP